MKTVKVFAILSLIALCACTRDKIVYVETPKDEFPEELMRLGEPIVLESSPPVNATFTPYNNAIFDLSGIPMVQNRTASEFVVKTSWFGECHPEVWALNIYTNLGDRISSDDALSGTGCTLSSTVITIHFSNLVDHVLHYVDTNYLLTLWDAHGSLARMAEMDSTAPTITVHRFDSRYRKTRMQLNELDVPLGLVTDGVDLFSIGSGGVYRLSAQGKLEQVVIPDLNYGFESIAYGNARLWLHKRDSVFTYTTAGIREGAFRLNREAASAMAFLSDRLYIAGQEMYRDNIYVINPDASLRSGAAVVERVITGVPGPIYLLTPRSDNLLLLQHRGMFWEIDTHGLRLRNYRDRLGTVTGFFARSDIIVVAHTGPLIGNWRAAAMSQFRL